MKKDICTSWTNKCSLHEYIILASVEKTSEEDENAV